jgi:hypothetical protein
MRAPVRRPDLQCRRPGACAGPDGGRCGDRPALRALANGTTSPNGLDLCGGAQRSASNGHPTPCDGSGRCRSRRGHLDRAPRRRRGVDGLQHRSELAGPDRYRADAWLSGRNRLGRSRHHTRLNLRRRPNRRLGRLRSSGSRRSLDRQGGRSRNRTTWEQRQGIDVALVVARDADTEVHVRIREIGLAARADRADHRCLVQPCPSLDADRAEMHERQRVAERSLDRHRLPTRRNGPGERDHTRGGCVHRGTAARAEVNPSVLSGRIRVSTVERERAQHRPVDGPRPRLRGRHGQHARRDERQNQGSPHDLLLVASFENDATVARPVVRCQYWLQSTAVELIARNTCQP